MRKRVEQDPDLLRYGPAGVLHAIVDRIVDDYEPVLDGVEDDIEEVEEEVFAPDPPEPAAADLPPQARGARPAPGDAPLVEPLEQARATSTSTSPRSCGTYFRDVYDHASRVNEQVEGFREMLNSVLRANLTQVTVRQNDDVRKISAWVAILAVPTMIAGIYGMNFEHMPELKWTLGYPAVLVVMLTRLHRGSSSTSSEPAGCRYTACPMSGFAARALIEVDGRTLHELERPLTRRLQRMVGDPPAAEDLRQEAFARAWTSAPRDADHDHLRAWVHRTAQPGGRPPAPAQRARLGAVRRRDGRLAPDPDPDAHRRARRSTA